MILKLGGKTEVNGEFVFCELFINGELLCSIPKDIIDRLYVENYCGFETVADLIADHKKLKESIKSWATRMDIINNVLVDYQQEQIIGWNNPVQSDVEELLHEMRAVNI